MQFSTAVILQCAIRPYSKNMQFSVESLHLSTAQADPHAIEPAAPDIGK
jgi:hypothetical protein